MTARHTHSDKSIDDILQSIRNVINNREAIKKDVNLSLDALEDLAEEELQLTEMIDDICNGDQMLSEDSRAKTESILEDFIETATTLGVNNMEEEVAPAPSANSPIEAFMLELLRPQLREWLDQNLPNMVKQIVSDEIKSLVANIRKH